MFGGAMNLAGGLGSGIMNILDDNNYFGLF